MTEYRYRDGRSIPGVDPAAAHAELTRIRDAHDGTLAPEDVFEDSRPKDAVLHPAFEWDKTAAFRKWNVHLARNIIRSVYIVPAPASEQRETPAFVHVGRGDYQPIDVVVSRPDLFEAALDELHQKLADGAFGGRELEHAAKQGNDPDRLAAIALAVQGFETVKAALAVIRAS